MDLKSYITNHATSNYLPPFQCWPRIYIWPGPLFTKGVDASLQDLAKTRIRKILFYTFPITLKFDRHLGGAAEMPVKFQSDTIIITPNLTTSRFGGKRFYRLVSRDPVLVIVVSAIATARNGVRPSASTLLIPKCHVFSTNVLCCHWFRIDLCWPDKVIQSGRWDLTVSRGSWDVNAWDIKLVS